MTARTAVLNMHKVPKETEEHSCMHLLPDHQDRNGRRVMGHCKTRLNCFLCKSVHTVVHVFSMQFIREKMYIHKAALYALKRVEQFILCIYMNNNVLHVLQVITSESFYTYLILSKSSKVLFLFWVHAQRVLS